MKYIHKLSHTADVTVGEVFKVIQAQSDLPYVRNPEYAPEWEDAPPGEYRVLATGTWVEFEVAPS